jgi:hypothetical protein
MAVGLLKPILWPVFITMPTCALAKKYVFGSEGLVCGAGWRTLALRAGFSGKSFSCRSRFFLAGHNER